MCPVREELLSYTGLRIVNHRNSSRKGGVAGDEIPYIHSFKMLQSSIHYLNHD